MAQMLGMGGMQSMMSAMVGDELMGHACMGACMRLVCVLCQGACMHDGAGQTGDACSPPKPDGRGESR